LFDGSGLLTVANPWGADGDAHRSRWLGRFGLDQSALREGVKQIYTGTGDLAELVFTARQGSGARQLLKDLDQRADALFKSHRGNKSAQVRAAMTQFRQQQDAIKAAVVRSSSVAEAESALRARTTERDAAVTREQTANRAVRALGEQRRCLEHVHLLQGVRRALAALQAQGLALDAASLRSHDQAVAAIETDRQQQTQLQAQVATLTGECATLTVDDNLLADGGAIDALYPRWRPVSDVARAHGPSANDWFGRCGRSPRHRSADQPDQRTGRLARSSRGGSAAEY
jgi:hypothetical protein